MDQEPQDVRQAACGENGDGLLSDWQRKAAGIIAGRSGDEPVALDVYEDAHQRFFVNAELNFEREREKHGLAGFDANLSALSPKRDYANRSYILDDHTHMMKRPRFSGGSYL